MCYAKPGPRCSGHTKADLDRAKDSGDQAAIDAAQEAYDASPQGLTDLRKEALDLHAEGRDEEAEALAERAKAAKARRDAQLAAYKEAHPEEFKNPAKAPESSPVKEETVETEVEVAAATPTKPSAPAVVPVIPASLMAPAAPQEPVLPAHLSSTGRARTSGGAHVDGDHTSVAPVPAPTATPEPVLPARLSTTATPRTAQRDPNDSALPPVVSVAPRPQEPDARAASTSVKRATEQASAKPQKKAEPETFSARVSAFVKPVKDRVKGRVDQFLAREGDEPARYLDHANPKVRAAAASNPRLSSTVLADLATDRSPEVRIAVARNRNTGINTVATVLASDPNRRVREALAGNSKTPPEVLKELARDASPQVQLELAGNPSTPRHILDDYFHPAAKFSNAKQVPKHYPRGYADAINEKLAQNHAMNPDILRDLVKNGSSKARGQARFTLREMGLPTK